MEEIGTVSTLIVVLNDVVHCLRRRREGMNLIQRVSLQIVRQRKGGTRERGREGGRKGGSGGEREGGREGGREGRRGREGGREGGQGGGEGEWSQLTIATAAFFLSRYPQFSLTRQHRQGD